jgi:hemolysin III
MPVYQAVQAITAALVQRQQRGQPAIAVNLDGNLLLSEVGNSITHGFGFIFSIVGTFLLLSATASAAPRVFNSCLIYSVSLITLYISSTLYHSFFALKTARAVFSVFDHAAIYLLIAGTYTPYLSILFPENMLWSTWLLAFLWVCCVLGIVVEAFYHGEHKSKISLGLYLGMGWAVLVCFSDLVAICSRAELISLFVGGLCYTGGVHYFIQDGAYDHMIWHVFVLAGSMVHWAGVYFYLIQRF